MSVIAAHSMITSLGCDAATSCASARAGLSRAGEVAGLKFGSDVTGAAEPLIAHAVPLLTRGFEGPVRLQRLLLGGLSELKAKLPQSVLRAGPVGFYLSLPDPRRTLFGLELVASDGARDTLVERAEGDPEPSDARFAHDLLLGAAHQAGWPGEIDLRQVSLAGHAGGLHCIALAERDLAAGTVMTAIVGATDSLLDTSTIAWLHSTNRLKLSGMPVGLMPGEACAFIALSNAAHEAEASITGVGLTREPKTLLSGATSVGEGLAGALEKVAEMADWKRAPSAWLLCDQNGETYRANEWGHVVARMRGDWPALASTEVWLPAASFGDTGSSSSLVSVCTALQAFRRSYAPAPTAMVVASSEGELRAALTISSRQVLS